MPDVIRFNVGFKDFRFLQGRMARRVVAKSRRQHMRALLGVVFCATFLALAIYVNLEPYRTLWLRAYGVPYPMSAYLLLILFLVLAIVALLPAVRFRMKTLRLQVSDEGPLLGATEMTLEEDGLRVDRRAVKSKYLWSAFQGVEVAKNAIILPIDNGIGLIVPASAFKTDAERFEFAAALSRKLNEARSRSGL